jgi:hypothetical protein
MGHQLVGVVLGISVAVLAVSPNAAAEWNASDNPLLLFGRYLRT